MVYRIDSGFPRGWSASSKPNGMDIGGFENQSTQFDAPGVDSSHRNGIAEQSEHVWATRVNARRSKAGDRTTVACIHCKERKQKCDARTPTCGNCLRFHRECLVEDPATGRHYPRNYLQSLEERVATLEAMLQEARPEVASDHLLLAPQLTTNRTIETMSSTSSSIDHLYPRSPILGPSPGLHSQTADSRWADGQAEDLNDLSSKIGLLSVNAPNAEPHYFGTSSALALSRAINSALRRIDPKEEIDSSDDYFGTSDVYDPSLATACPLPSAEGRQALSKSYFDHIHPQYPVIHEPIFRAWEELLVQSSEAGDTTNIHPSIPFFVNMIYALGRLIQPWGAPYSSERLYTSAQCHMNAVMQVNSIESIQALVLCTLYSLRSRHFGSVWCLTGMALRQCIELGYHRNPKLIGARQMNSLQIELRKRVFWCAYDLDRSAAITFGRPFGIPDEEIDVEYPLEINDDLIAPNGLFHNFQTHNGGPSTMSGAVHMFRLRRIWSKIHTSLYACGRRHPPCGEHSQIAQLRQELDSWQQAIPLYSPEMAVIASKPLSADWFKISYNHSILLLYRRRITSPRGTEEVEAYEEAFVQCAQAAREVCNCYRRIYVGKSAGYTWEALHILFLAGLTYLHCLWTSSKVKATTRLDDFSATCMTCTMVLVAMAERWVPAAPYRDIFEALAAKTMSMMVNQEQYNFNAVHSEGANTASKTAPVQEVPFDMSQWIGNMTDVDMTDDMETILTAFFTNVRPGQAMP